MVTVRGGMVRYGTVRTLAFAVDEGQTPGLPQCGADERPEDGEDAEEPQKPHGDARLLVARVDAARDGGGFGALLQARLIERYDQRHQIPIVRHTLIGEH